MLENRINNNPAARKDTRRPSLKQSKTSRKQKVGQVDKDEHRGTALIWRGKAK